MLYDLHGTLVDTMQTFADVAADVMAEVHGLDWQGARDAYLATSGIPFFQQLELIAPADRRNARAVAAFETRKVEATAHVVPSDATLVAIHRLRMRGFKVAVSSNNFQNQVDLFVQGCRAPFDLALGFGDGLAKGMPHFDYACRQLGCTTDELLFVGDSLADAAIATDAGVRFVGRLGTFKADAFRTIVPDAPLIAEIDELLTMFS